MSSGLRAVGPVIVVGLLLASCTDYRPVTVGSGASWEEARRAAYVRGGADRRGTLASSAVRTMPTRPIPPDGRYLVLPGDTVSNLAATYGVPAQQIIALNDLKPPFHIYVGQVLALKGRVDERNLHIVRPGESMATIARQRGYRLGDLIAMNPELDPHKIYAGQRIRLPAARAVASDVPRTTVPAARMPESRPQSSLRVAATSPAPDLSGDGFIWPVEGTVISTFGAKPNGMRNDGINIKAARGSVVRAAEHGIVVYAGESIPAFGRMLLIKHDDSYLTTYAHNDVLLVAVGDRVKRGQPIAKVGASGDVVDAQLHFEIRRGKTPLDPVRHLAGPVRLAGKSG